MICLAKNQENYFGVVADYLLIVLLAKVFCLIICSHFLFWLLPSAGVTTASRHVWNIWWLFCTKWFSWHNLGSSLQPQDHRSASLTTKLPGPPVIQSVFLWSICNWAAFWRKWNSESIVLFVKMEMPHGSNRAVLITGAENVTSLCRGIRDYRAAEKRIFYFHIFEDYNKMCVLAYSS